MLIDKLIIQQCGPHIHHNITSTSPLPFVLRPCIVFFQVDWLTEKMRQSNFTVASMHGDMVQKEREAIMGEFRCAIFKKCQLSPFL